MKRLTCLSFTCLVLAFFWSTAAHPEKGCILLEVLAVNSLLTNVSQLELPL